MAKKRYIPGDVVKNHKGEVFTVMGYTTHNYTMAEGVIKDLNTPSCVFLAPLHSNFTLVSAMN